jgi:ABC-type phosphate transport system substrate-binding protein
MRVLTSQAKPYGMTFLTWADSVGSTAFARMINKANKLVEPSVASVQAAMTSFSDEYAKGNFEIDIIDANGTDAWPLAWMTHFGLARNASSLDCTNVKELLSFIAWVHTNDAYAL